MNSLQAHQVALTPTLVPEGVGVNSRMGVSCSLSPRERAGVRVSRVLSGVNCRMGVSCSLSLRERAGVRVSRTRSHRESVRNGHEKKETSSCRINLEGRR